MDYEYMNTLLCLPFGVTVFDSFVLFRGIAFKVTQNSFTIL
jgi:hypothetical protein